MKKTILTLVGLLMIGAGVNAQSDSTTTNVPDNYSQMNQAEPSGTSAQQPVNQDRVRVQATDLPASMRQTLSGAQYKGWESAPIYMNKSTNQYSFDLANNGTTKTYTFDQSGKPITGPASSTTTSSSSTTTTDNSSTYSSKNTATPGGTKSSATKVHKSSVKKSSSPSNNSSSSTTTPNSPSGSTTDKPATK